MSYQKLANQFKINNPSMIARRVIDFRNQGLDGLKRKREENLQVWLNTIKCQKKQYSEEEIDEIKKLKEEYYWTQMEIDFLKKRWN